MKTHAFIICWPGKEEIANQIYDEILYSVDLITVIYSTKDDADVNSKLNWHRVPDSWYYGKKFSEILKLFNEDLLIQIHADTSYSDWGLLLKECKSAFLNEQVGIWSPDFDNTAWDLSSVRIGGMQSGLIDVCQTDCIIWALNYSVCHRLKQYNFSFNNFGWGIDWAAICYCYSHNLRVVKDPRFVVTHFKGSGYIHSDAFTQMARFLDQMSLQEKNQLALLESKIATNKNSNF